MPGDIKPIIGRGEGYHSLGLVAGQEQHAAKLIGDYNAAYSTLIAQARVQRLTGQAAAFAMQTPPAAARVTAADSAACVTISEAYAYDNRAWRRAVREGI